MTAAQLDVREFGDAYEAALRSALNSYTTPGLIRTNEAKWIQAMRLAIAEFEAK